MIVVVYESLTTRYVVGHGQCTGLEQCTCDDCWSSGNCGTANCTSLDDCSSQGQCVAPDSCECYDRFDGADCNQPQGEERARVQPDRLLLHDERGRNHWDVAPGCIRDGR